MREAFRCNRLNENIYLNIFTYLHRHYRYEKKLACLLWKVDVKDIILPRTSSEYTLNNLRSTVNVSQVDANGNKCNPIKGHNVTSNCFHCTCHQVLPLGPPHCPATGDAVHLIIPECDGDARSLIQPPDLCDHKFTCRSSCCSIETSRRNLKHGPSSRNVCQSADVSPLLVLARNNNNNACQVPEYKLPPPPSSPSPPPHPHHQCTRCGRQFQLVPYEWSTRDYLNVTEAIYCLEGSPVISQDNGSGSQNNFVCMEADSSETRHNSVSSLQPLLLQSHDHI